MEPVKIVALQWKDGTEIKPYDPAPNEALYRAYRLLWNLAYQSTEQTLVVDKDGVLIVGLHYCGERSYQPRDGQVRMFVVDLAPEVATYCRCMDQVERDSELPVPYDTKYADKRTNGRNTSGSEVEHDLAFQAAGKKEVTA